MSERTERITRDDLEVALRDLQGDLNRDSQPLLVKIAYGVAAVGLLLIGVAYLAGRLTGRRRSTIVEVRRI